MINNRQAGRRRGRGSQRPQSGQGGRGAEQGNRIDNRARGNASQLHEKYKTLARDAQTQGDRVMTEYYLQFADHYFRVLSETRARFEENRRQRDDVQDYDDDGEDGRSADDSGNEDEVRAEGEYRQQQQYQQRNRNDRNDRNDRPREQRQPMRREMRDDRQDGYQDNRDNRGREDMRGNEGQSYADQRPPRETPRSFDRSPARENREGRDTRDFARENGREDVVQQTQNEARAEEPRRAVRAPRARRPATVEIVQEDAPQNGIEADRLPPSFLTVSIEASDEAEAAPRPRVRRPRKIVETETQPES